MHRSRAPSIAPGTFFVAQSWADSITDMPGFNLRQAHTKLDRLGRSTRELLDLIERIGKAGASFRSLGDPLWDTSSSQGRLLSTLLAAIAEFERDLIRERTGDGRKRAQANGVKFGRKPKLSDYQRQEALKRRATGETLAAIAKSYGVDISMISRLA
jgi:DNA invertase Pin-like site-specific DNA recombinase